MPTTVPDYTPLPLGLVLRAAGAPTQAEVLAFEPGGGDAPPLATFAAVLPEAVVESYPVFPHDAYAAWLSAHPSAPVSAVNARGVQTHYATQELRDLALAAALQDPAVEGVFTPVNSGYWTYPEHPQADQPFALFTAFYNCYDVTWWDFTPVPFLLDLGTEQGGAASQAPALVPASTPLVLVLFALGCVLVAWRLRGGYAR